MTSERACSRHAHRLEVELPARVACACLEPSARMSFIWARRFGLNAAGNGAGNVDAAGKNGRYDLVLGASA